ncbi:MAG TPA: ribosome biogenesis factor YjgA [Accumulibacter sp.]|uniref:ribosome biogenesis factor YjgA n=1 Tax=Accumulibacter sp. TaxID=2053492 RepID=UPI002BB1E01C|nr:ribosome biogenesis factor YjgA [Accumulibacter sp.]HNK03262.1 ribosome biogenesis factor YjgA [Accumulibacter sp.]
MNSPEQESVPLSKTRRKRMMEDLQALGEQLVELSAERLQRMQLPEDLRIAVDAARGMLRHNDARRRQMQFIGRLMRQVDAEPLRQALAVVRGDAACEVARQHRIEQLRADILADERTLQRLADEFPALDIQRLRSLRRSALLEQAQAKPPRSFRALYRELRELAPADLETVNDENDEHR